MVRIGNFINGELFGRTTEMPWGMIFPGGGPLPRHPSQLYEAFFEGAVLFFLLWPLRNKPWKQKSWPHGSLFALLLMFYGIFRYGIEFFREPDAHLGFVFLNMTMGQVLCAAMVTAGILLLFFLRKLEPENNDN